MLDVSYIAITNHFKEGKCQFSINIHNKTFLKANIHFQKWQTLEAEVETTRGKETRGKETRGKEKKIKETIENIGTEEEDLREFQKGEHPERVEKDKKGRIAEGEKRSEEAKLQSTEH